jgi:hypothetical protein
MEEAGGANNAYTSEDITVYYDYGTCISFRNISLA